MKLLASIILTALLAFVFGLFTQLPWWCFVISSFVVALAIQQSPGKSFLSGFAGLWILWVALALLKDTPNQHILSTKVAQILPLGGSSMVLILVTGIVGGLVSGLAALTASFIIKVK
ncbi:MAG: hypothetical protein EAZ35_00490 [Sphingobacteriia bacterium]|jgi:hypothetical protein|nr:MAG: hypothetical protein EAZ41_05090 [Sphingobacteriia bacterium]TAG32085.1 MAG: hypothetical protein EAZ35_00490 [Sphingobacteriia bacterium]